MKRMYLHQVKFNGRSVIGGRWLLVLFLLWGMVAMPAQAGDPVLPTEMGPIHGWHFCEWSIPVVRIG